MTTDNNRTFKTGIVKNAELINKMVAIVRKDLNTLERTLMGALIVIDVHARDVVTELVAKSVKNLNDFEFSKQLRYYWDA